MHPLPEQRLRVKGTKGLLRCLDPGLVADLRFDNKGQPEKYSDILQECQRYIAEKVETAVGDRRHDVVQDGDPVVHLAAALSALTF